MLQSRRKKQPAERSRPATAGIAGSPALKEEWFRTTLYSIGDAVITTDRRGRVQQMNPVAERRVLLSPGGKRSLSNKETHLASVSFPKHKGADL
jgi:PAS domain-containing protein